MFVGPRVQVNTVKGDSLPPNSNHSDVRANLAIEAISVHAQVSWRITEANEPWDNYGRGLRISHVIPSCRQRADNTPSVHGFGGDG
jgi:hypothetical protein